MFSWQQGELAHKIVKRLYGSTNKLNAEPQIAKRYRRLERARLALDTKRLHTHTKQKTTNQDDNQPDGDSELRYNISPSKNCPQDIFGTLRDNRGDPAYHVRCPSNASVTILTAFKENFTKASRSFAQTTNRPWIWCWHARRIHWFRSKFHTLCWKQDLFCSNMQHLLHQLWLTAAVWHRQPSYTPRYYAALSR